MTTDIDAIFAALGLLGVALVIIGLTVAGALQVDSYDRTVAALTELPPARESLLSLEDTRGDWPERLVPTDIAAAYEPRHDTPRVESPGPITREFRAIVAVLTVAQQEVGV